MDRHFRRCLFLLAFLQGSSLACIFPTLQSRMDSLGASFVVYGVAVGIYSISGTCFSPLAGRLYTPKLFSCWQLIMGLSLLSLLGNIIFLIPSVPAVIVGRFFAGLAWAANPPALAYLSTPVAIESGSVQADGSNVQSALSYFMTSQVVGYAIGPVFSAFISSSYSIDGFDFDVYTIAGCVITFLWVVFIVLFAFLRKHEIPQRDSDPPLNSSVETHQEISSHLSPTSDRTSLGAVYRRIVVLALSNYVVVSVLLSSETLFAKIAEDYYGISIQTTSLIFLAFGGSMAIVMFFQPQLSAWYGNDGRALILAELATMLLFLLLFPYGNGDVALWRTIVGYGATLVFGGLSYALGFQILAKMVARVPSGMLMGIMSTMGNLARFTSPLWVTAVYSNFGATWDYIVNAVSLFVILAGLLLLGFFSAVPPQEPESFSEPLLSPTDDNPNLLSDLQ